MISFKSGERNLLTDVPGVLVGNASNEELKSGSTVVTAKEAFAASVFRGGAAPGARETDLLDCDSLISNVDAIVLSGGSALGLDAAGGVANALRKRGKGFAINEQTVPLVPSAIIFDLNNGGDKNWSCNPYQQLGEDALADASPEFSLGSYGAGCGALTADLKGGLGSASLEIQFPDNKTGYKPTVSVAALAVVNPVGSVTVPHQPNFWAANVEFADEFGGLGVSSSDNGLTSGLPALKPVVRQNTTLIVVATDAPMNASQLRRLAVSANTGLARAIYPSNTPFDGDMVFAVSTSAVESGRELIEEAGRELVIGHAAALCVSRAIARGVYHAESAPGDRLPTWQQKWGNRYNR